MAEAMRARYGSRAVVITDGERGCAIAARDTALRVPAFRDGQVDTTGAGDAFLGALLAGLRWGLSWRSDRTARQCGRRGLHHAAGRVSVRLRAARRNSRSSTATRCPPCATASRGSPRRTARARSIPSAEVERFFDTALAELAALRGAIDLDAIRARGRDDSHALRLAAAAFT